MTQETRLKMSNKKIGKQFSCITKNKLSKSKLGKNNPFYGKEFTKKHRENLRIAAIRRIQEQGKVVAYNPKACKFIDEYGKQNGYDFQHAMNGGEVVLSGYPVDGYDKNKNVVFEYDEPYHHNKHRKQKDIEKQNNIIESIHPSEFIRYDEINDKLYRVM